LRSFLVHRRHARITSLALSVAVLAPVAQNWRAEPADGFPLSYYPMFSLKREATAPVTHLIGLDGSGHRTRLHARLSGLGGGMNQVRKQLTKAVKNGEAPQLCQYAARTVSRSADPDLARIREVRLITARYDLEGFFRGNTRGTDSKVHARCPVER
jgi:hypothetical protein